MCANKYMYTTLNTNKYYIYMSIIVPEVLFILILPEYVDASRDMCK